MIKTSKHTNMHTYKHTNTHTRPHVHTYMHTHTRTHVHTCSPSYVCTHAHTHTHTNKHQHTQNHMHTHTYQHKHTHYWEPSVWFESQTFSWLCEVVAAILFWLYDTRGHCHPYLICLDKGAKTGRLHVLGAVGVLSIFIYWGDSDQLMNRPIAAVVIFFLLLWVQCLLLSLTLNLRYDTHTYT